VFQVPDSLTEAEFNPLDSARVVGRLDALSQQDTINRLSNDRHILSQTNAKLRKERDWYKELFEAAYQDRRVFESESMLMMEEWLQDRNSRSPMLNSDEEHRCELRQVRSENSILTKQVEVLAKALSENMRSKEQAESEVLKCKQQMAMEKVVQEEALARERDQSARLRAQLSHHPRSLVDV